MYTQCHPQTPKIYHPGQPQRSVQTVPQVSGGRVGGGMAQPLPPRVDPLDHNGSCNGARTGDKICDPVGGATMFLPPAGRAL